MIATSTTWRQPVKLDYFRVTDSGRAVGGSRNGIRVRCWQRRTRQSRPRQIWCLCARFRVWLRFLAISELVAVGWFWSAGSTPLERFINRFATGPGPS